MTEDRIQGFDINSQGYGTVPKAVMQSQEISIKAKAVYAYFCSFTGAGHSCFPSRNKICLDLEISKDSLTKYIRELKKAGFLQVKQEKTEGRFLRNVYTLTDTKIPCPKISDTDDFGHGNLASKNNSSKTNSIYKNNSEEKKKERKTNGYDDILSSIEDTSLKDLYLEYIKMRKLIKSPMTDRALEMLIHKVESLETDVERQKKLLEVAIINNWKSVYPLKGDEGNGLCEANGHAPVKAEGIIRL